MRDQIFIAYSHRDEKWLRRLHLYLRPYLGDTWIHAYDDRTIEHNAGWRAAIKNALVTSKVVLLLVSQDFLASDFLAVELRDLLKEEEKNGPTILWIPVRASLYERSAISQYQALLDPSRPLDHLPPAKREEVLVRVAEKIWRVFQAGDEGEGKSHDIRPGALTPSTVEADASPAPATDTSKEGHTFVCYAREDEKFVLKLATDLKASGANIWLDQWNIPGGADWDYEIDKALYDCHRFLIILSPTAVESKEVRSELRTALDEGKRIVPVLYQACRIPRRLKLIQHVDFASGKFDDETNLKQLLRDLA